MFGKHITIFRVFGWDINIDSTWIFLAVLVTWSLATGVFPARIPGLTEGTYWAMGAGGAFALFASIIFHELGHALVARRHGIEIRDITLFIFGGVANMTKEPPNAKAEFRMAIAGPIASVILCVVLMGIEALLAPEEGKIPAIEVLAYIALLNGILAVFNLLPAYPLDGGRMLRAALWSWKEDLRWATRIASNIGGAFGMTLIVLGVLFFISGAIVGGLWWFMIGMFIRMASRASYSQILLKITFEGEPVSRFMRADVITISPQATIRTLVEDYIYHHHYKMIPVARDGHLLGCVTTRQVKTTPQSEWDSHTVGDIMGECNDQNSIGPNEDALEAMTKMNLHDNRRLMVVDNGELVGVITLKDLLEFLALKIDLESGTRK